MSVSPTPYSRAETQHRSVPHAMLAQGLLTGTIIGGLFLLFRHLETGGQRAFDYSNLQIGGISAILAVAGAMAGSRRAEAHNRFADMLQHYETLDRQGRLLPESLPATHPNRLRNASTEALTGAASGAILGSGLWLLVEFIAHGGHINRHNLDFAQLPFDMAIWGGIIGGARYQQAKEQNHRADVAGYFSQRAHANAAQRNQIGAILAQGPAESHQQATLNAIPLQAERV